MVRDTKENTSIRLFPFLMIHLFKMGVQEGSKNLQTLCRLLKGISMKPHQAVNEWIHHHFNPMEVTVESYPQFPCGQRVIDDTGDYAVVFFAEDKNQVVYFFKDAEDSWFYGDLATLTKNRSKTNKQNQRLCKKMVDTGKADS